jgi:hypothetical protein
MPEVRIVTRNFNRRWRFGVGVVVLVAFIAGCASAPSRPVRSEFEDIPVPKGLTLDLGKTTIIESPSVKAARLFYKGRIEPASLATAFRTTLEANGWRFISTTTFSSQGTTQVYEKTGDSLTVVISEGIFYTWVEMTVTKVIGRPGGTSPAPASR